MTYPDETVSLFIPRGETILKAGDVLVFVAEGEARETVVELCRQPEQIS